MYTQGGVTCQEVFIDFSIYIKYDMLINTKKSSERRGYTKLWSIIKRKSVSYERTYRP